MLYQKRAETRTSDFGVLYFGVCCGWMYHRAEFSGFLADFLPQALVIIAANRKRNI